MKGNTGFNRDLSADCLIMFFQLIHQPFVISLINSLLFVYVTTDDKRVLLSGRGRFIQIGSRTFFILCADLNAVSRYHVPVKTE